MDYVNYIRLNTYTSSLQKLSSSYLLPWWPQELPAPQSTIGKFKCVAITWQRFKVMAGVGWHSVGGNVTSGSHPHLIGVEKCAVHLQLAWQKGSHMKPAPGFEHLLGGR